MDNLGGQPWQFALQRYHEVVQELNEAGISSAPANARALVQMALEHEGSLLLVQQIPQDFDARLKELVKRRLNFEPLQLIQGYAPFRYLRLATKAGVFIPRPETEVAIDLVHEWRQGETSLKIIDACTGSGTLAAACLDEIAKCLVSAFDFNPAAVELARDNCLQVASAQRFEIFQAELPKITHLDQSSISKVVKFIEDYELAAADVFLANPPYIPANCQPKEREVQLYDPHEALFGGGVDGLDIPRSVVLLAGKILKKGGLLVMEHADVQGPACRDLAYESGFFGEIETVNDLTGKPRFLRAIKL